MRIGIFTSVEDRGGVQTFSMNLCRGLRRLGHELIILTPSPETEAAQRILDETSLAADHVAVLNPASDPLHFIRQLSSRIRDESLDVFVPNFWTTTYAACAAIRPGLRPKIVGICHDNTLAYYGLLWHYQKIVDEFVCPSRLTYRIMRRVFNDRPNSIHHIHHPLEWPDVSPPEAPAGSIALLYHGRLVDAQKNISQIVRLGAVLKCRGISSRITLVGQGDAEARCRQLAHELGLQEQIAFHGPCGPEGLRSYFSTHHVSLLTSSHEGFCISLAEAMSVGLPGIAFECGGVIEEYLHNGSNGFVVPFGDLEAMADHVTFFCKNPEAWLAFSERAQAEIRGRYALDTSLERYAELLAGAAADSSLSSWPRFRPVYSSAGSRLRDRVIERAGSHLGAWPGYSSMIRDLSSLGVHQ